MHFANTIICVRITNQYFRHMVTAEKMLNVRVPAALDRELDRLVAATGRTWSFPTLEALKNYLADQSWQVQDIREAIAEADRGEFASAREVAAYKRKWINE